jgi:hypothetical protein
MTKTWFQSGFSQTLHSQPGPNGQPDPLQGQKFGISRHIRRDILREMVDLLSIWALLFRKISPHNSSNSPRYAQNMVPNFPCMDNFGLAFKGPSKMAQKSEKIEI